MNASTIARDPRLATVVYEASSGDFADPPPAVAAAYQDNHCVVFPPVDLDADVAWLRTLRPAPQADPGRAIAVKKAKAKWLLTDDPADPNSILRQVAGSEKAARRFLAEVRRVHARVMAFVRAAFPGVTVLNDRDFTWRLTTTADEAMHFDNYGFGPVDHGTLRVFVNLDDRPRHWALGPTFPVGLAACAAKLDRAHWDLHPNQLNLQVNLASDWEATPRHHLLLAPLAAWVVNSQAVAHEIVWGRKLIAYSVHVDPATLPDPAKDFNAAARRAVADLRPKETA